MNKNRVLKKTLAAGLAVMVAGSTCCLDAGVVYASDKDAGKKDGKQETKKGGKTRQRQSRMLIKKKRFM